MRDKILIVLLLIGIFRLDSVWASGEEQPEEEIASGTSIFTGGVRTIQSIDFVNNETFKDKTLLKQLDFKVGDDLDTFLVGSGGIDISEYYRKKGFADIQVTVDSSSVSQGQIIYVIDEGRRQQIRTIRFLGNEQIPTGELQSIIKTNTRSWWFWPSYYTEEKLASDVQKLRNFYYERGFLNHQINSIGRSNITFLIEEGLRYDVNDITVSGNTYFNDETLLDGIKLAPGQIYYPLKATEHAQTILSLYQENGFINARIEQGIRFAPAGINKVDVEYRITESNQYKIGHIEIIGNEQTQDRVIRNVLEEYDFSPGKLYNADIAPVQSGGELEQRIQGRTLAEEVIITPVVPAEDAEDTRDASVSIKEGLTGSWNPGIAYSSDSGIVGQLLWSQRNFDVADWPESFTEFITMQSFKGAGQSMSINLQPGREVSYYSVAFSEPYFQDKPVSLDVVGSSYERWRESHDEKRKKGYFGFERRYKNLWRSSFGLRIENVEVEDIDYDAPQEIYDVAGNNLLIGMQFGLGKDATDSLYTPSRGYKFSINYEQVTGEDDFGILMGSGVLYKTLFEDIRERKTVLATKLLAATTLSDTPPFEKFYAGGIGTYGIRGFEFRGISPRGLQTNVVDPQAIDPIGSDWIFLANTELIVPLVGDNISALFFIDSGTVETGSYRAAIGAGIQVTVPQLLGYVPMRLSIARALNKDDDDETQTFSFFMGSQF